MGKVANINILLIIAYTVIEASPPYENKILFTNNTVRLTIACRKRVTEPKDKISFTIPNWILNALRFGIREGLPKIKKYSHKEKEENSYDSKTNMHVSPSELGKMVRC